MGLNYYTISSITFICRGRKIERGKVGVGEREASKIPNSVTMDERSTYNEGGHVKQFNLCIMIQRHGMSNEEHDIQFIPTLYFHK